jgi:uncharacterized lipoprotein YddW (UPF0748 family)
MSDTSTDYMLTTIDNPFNPFTQFNEWFMWDVNAGYNSSALLARIANVSNSLSEPDQAQAILDAIDEIVSENVNGMFIKVSRDGSTTMQNDYLSSNPD